VDCKKCGLIGHYASVCRADANRDAKQAVSAISEGYSASLAGAPSCLRDAVVVTVKETSAKALLDTGASESFTHEGLVREIGLKSSG